MLVSEYIKEYRQINNLSQEEFGKLIGVSQDTISLWEKGILYPDYTMLKKLCKILNVSGDEILDIK